MTTGTNQDRAREIMGSNFLGVDEVVRHLGVVPTHKQLGFFKRIPYSGLQLEESKDTHVLSAVFPLSILKILINIEKKSAEVGPNRKVFYKYETAWYNNERFVREVGESGWQLIRKTPVQGSACRNWLAQLELIGEDEEVPCAQALLYTIAGHFLATGERLFETTYARTSSVDFLHFNVFLGGNNSDGLRICKYPEEKALDVLGISSAKVPQRKF